MNSSAPASAPIAIVGMACRYPDADTVDQLFVNSLAQRRAFRRIPDTRLSSGYFDPSGKSRDRAYARQAAVLKGFNFDRRWFRVSDASYDATDLTHWLALTVARETIEDIRFRKGGAHSDKEGVRVVVGNTLTGEFSRASLLRLRWPYVRDVMIRHLREQSPDLDVAERDRQLRDLELRYKSPFPVPNEDFLAGGLANTIAGRICNHFDFRGGGYTVDGACSSSLLAVADACTALASGDADLVLAGGVDLSLDPFELVGFSRSAALARSEMLVYDEQSEGFWPGEGCGFVALMRYEDALEQCEHVHAVIRGWGISSDGRGGLTRPEAEGQMLALQRCYKRAGYGIESVGYFEGHGTGTKVGDTAELKALIGARSKSGNPIHPAVISSIKANIGHTKAAAGLAGLLRTTKCISENVLPPTTACRRPHALFAVNARNLATSERPRSWEAGTVARRAGVSAMGFGGINTHITIEEAPAPARTSISVGDLSRFEPFQDTELFLFAAYRKEDLAWTIGHVASFAEACSRSELTDLAVEMTRRVNRGALSRWKAAVVAATPAELSRKLTLLQEALAGADDDHIHLSAADGVFLAAGNVSRRVGLIFSGQGSPVRADGGIHARRFDAVRQVYQQADLDSFDHRDDTDFAQPAIVTGSLAGLAMLQRLGVRGDVAIGHSLGELSALHWAGCFDTAALLAIARARGKAMVDDANTTGAMVAVAADSDWTSSVVGRQENLFVANINSPRQTVVSGRRGDVEALAARLQREGVAATLLRVRQAFHTPAMAGVATAFKGMLNNRHFSAAEGKIISTVTGQELPAETDIAAYLGDQLVAPVQFLSAATLASKEVDLFLEVGPGDVMANLTGGFCGKPVIPIDVGGESLAPLLHAAAATYVLGCAPKIGELFDDRFARPFDWGWNPKFLQNPCEAFPEESASPLDIEAEAVEEPVAVALAEADESTSSLDRFRLIVSGHTGLPIWTLQDDTRMLSDLHLNSITVGEMITRFTASRGVLPPVDPTQYANASISEIAAALDQLEESGGHESADQRMAPAGVGAWVRFFEMTRVPAPALAPERRSLASGSWEGYGAMAPRDEALLRRLNADPHGQGVIVWLGDMPGESEMPGLLEAAQRCIERSRQSSETLSFVVVQRGWGGSGFARSFFLENQAIVTTVINVPPGLEHDPADMIATEIDAAATGFREVFLDAAGRRQELHLKLVKAPPRATSALVDEKDVVLVTGGGKGISAECGYQLARRTGCSLLILGRSAVDDSAELSGNLDRMRKAGLRVSYQMADVTAAGEVASAIAKGIAELGSPVTCVVHGAGLNVPRTVASLSIADLESTVSPKIAGLRNLLTAIDPGRLKLMVNFSSIIARIGLQGEADYALANEWLSHATQEFQARHPQCRCRAIEWSVWSGTGMGQRLGRLDALESQGISPISIDDGVREFLRLVDAPDLPVSLIVSGRFGNPPTIVFDRPPPQTLRFIDSIPVYYPETELIADCQLSPQSDPYLDDHVLNGERISPAVMALEAMTQAVRALMGNDAGAATPMFRDVAFRKAIVVPQGTHAGNMTLRVAVLAETEGDLSLVIRCSTTSFQVNHVEARCTLRNDVEVGADKPDVANVPAGSILPFDPDRALYRNVLFQSGRFRRIEGYQLIEARRCIGQLSAAGPTHWFSPELPQNCLLGDAGARDAALHAIQVCIPHKTLIPIAVAEIDGGVLDPSRPYRLSATEIEDRGDELVYDLTISGVDGRPVEHWRRITLRVIGEPPDLSLNAPSLMAPFVERRVAAIMPHAGLKVSIVPMVNARKPSTGPDRRPDGKPDPSIDGRFQSFAYSDEWKLAVDSALPVGCDLQSVPDRQDGYWQPMLGKEGFKLAEIVAGIANENLDVSATRIWTVREAMKKAGLAAGAPLVVNPEASTHWIAFNSGESAIFSSLIVASADVAPLCVAVALRPEQASIKTPRRRSAG